MSESRSCHTVHFTVSGRVQGVFFRVAAKQQADLLGVSGWVRNLPDGRVEGMACAHEDLLGEFRRWLHRGPDHARVLKVEWQKVPDQEFSGFTIR